MKKVPCDKDSAMYMNQFSLVIQSMNPDKLLMQIVKLLLRIQYSVKRLDFCDG